MGDVDGNVTDYADPFLRGVVLERAPLAVEDELLEMRVANGFFKLRVIGVAVPRVLGPLPPGGTAESALERPEPRVIGQPVPNVFRKTP